MGSIAQAWLSQSGYYVILLRLSSKTVKSGTILRRAEGEDLPATRAVQEPKHEATELSR